MITILDLQAQPHNSLSYVHIELMRDLYSKSLLPTEKRDDFPSNQ